MNTKMIKKAIKAALPAGLLPFAHSLQHAVRFYTQYAPLTAPNAQFKDIHKGQRCFILCSGPSINELDLKKLKGEISIGCSRHHQHPDYLYYAPLYHCIPQIDPSISESKAIELFEEMDACIGSAAFFMSCTDYNIVKEKTIFVNRPSLYYLDMSLPFDAFTQNMPDLEKCICGVQSVPIMALQIALYMGFSEIILLGTEHDSFQTKKYTYFYTNNIMSGHDWSVNTDGSIKREAFPGSEELACLSRLWKQYEMIKTIADVHNIKIVNATPGGVLDVFPRVTFESLF